jgi:quercetin dioxygenase-like cupin family protein
MTTLFDDILARAAAERERRGKADMVATREGADAELSRYGFLRWYLHPQIESAGTHAMYVAELSIPPGSRSGKWRHQGGIIHLVVAGTGHSTVNEVSHEWGPRDVIAVPPLPAGSVLQHVNDGAEEARILFVFPNYDSSLGPELGIEMEVLEPAPEWADQQ